jgi:hypothetical protein
MAVFVLRKLAEFNTFTRLWKLYEDEFFAVTHMFNRESVDNAIKQDIVAHAPWPIQLWLVDVDSEFPDQASTTHDQTSSVP